MSKLFRTFKRSVDKVRMATGLKSKPRPEEPKTAFGSTRELTDAEVAQVSAQSGQQPPRRRRNYRTNTLLSEPTDRLGP